MKLIGLHGIAKSGKDTTCQFILDWARSQGKTAKREAFADRLKISAAHALGVFEDEIAFCNALKYDGILDIEVRGFGEHGAYFRSVKGREYLQYYGTEAHREVFDTDFWVDSALPKRDWLNSDLDFLVFTDVRFPNEAARIHDNGGQIWHIIRDDVGNGDTHASEQALPDEMIDHRIFNDSSLEDLRSTAINLAERDTRD